MPGQETLFPDVIPDRPPWEEDTPDRPPWDDDPPAAPAVPQPAPEAAAALSPFPPRDPREGIPAMENYLRFARSKVAEFDKAGDEDGATKWAKTVKDHEEMLAQMRRGEQPRHPEFGPVQIRPSAEFKPKPGQDLVPDPFTGKIEPEPEFMPKPLPPAEEAYRAKLDYKAACHKNPPCFWMASFTTQEAAQAAANAHECSPGSARQQIQAVPIGDVQPITPDGATPDAPIIHPAIKDPTTAIAPLNRTAEALVRRANELVVHNQASADQAGTLMAELKHALKAVEASRRSWTDPLTGLVDRFRKMFRPTEDSLSSAIRTAEAKIRSWQEMERRKREEEARRQREEAEAQARAQAEAARQAAQEMAQALPPEQAAQIVQQTEQAANTIVKQAEDAPLAQVGAPQIAGVQTRMVWTFEVQDIKALCRAVADGQVPANFVEPASKIINASISGPNGIREIPGLQVFQKPVLASR